MERLWTPWRLAYVTGASGSVSGCIFCDALAPAISDHDPLVLIRCPDAYVILNRYPYNNGHLMVIPRMHASDVHALSEGDYQELSEMLRIALRLVGRAYAPQGANLGMNLGRVAGAGIADHLHWHVVPRWGGDTNFMPVLADSKVMIEHLHASWDRLRPLFDAEYRRGEPVGSW